MIEIKKNGDVIHKSRNLRGVLDHARRVGVKHVASFRRGQKADLLIHFGDDAMCFTEHGWRASYDFIKARRSWRLFEEKQTANEFYFHESPGNASVK